MLSDFVKVIMCNISMRMMPTMAKLVFLAAGVYLRSSCRTWSQHVIRSYISFFLPPLPQPPHSQLLFDSEMIVGMLRERPTNCKLDVFGLTGKDTITYLEKIFTLHCLEQSVPESLGNFPLRLWDALLHVMQAFEAWLWLAVAECSAAVILDPCLHDVQGSLSDFWRWYLSFWWLGQPNTSYCILSEERGNAV